MLVDVRSRGTLQRAAAFGSGGNSLVVKARKRHGFSRLITIGSGVNGISSAEAFGSAVITREEPIVPNGIESGEAFGEAVVDLLLKIIEAQGFSDEESSGGAGSYAGGAYGDVGYGGAATGGAGDFGLPTITQ